LISWQKVHKQWDTRLLKEQIRTLQAAHTNTLPKRQTSFWLPHLEDKREMFVGFVDINLAVVFAQDGHVRTGQLR
jgi:hypothetical protein